MVSCHRLHENLQIFCRCMRQPSALSFISYNLGTGQNHLPLDKKLLLLFFSNTKPLWLYLTFCEVCVCLFLFHIRSEIQMAKHSWFIHQLQLHWSSYDYVYQMSFSVSVYTKSLSLKENHYVISAHSCGSRPLLTCVLLLNKNSYKSGPCDV